MMAEDSFAPLSDFLDPLGAFWLRLVGGWKACPEHQQQAGLGHQRTARSSERCVNCTDGRFTAQQS